MREGACGTTTRRPRASVNVRGDVNAGVARASRQQRTRIARGMLSRVLGLRLELSCPGRRTEDCFASRSNRHDMGKNTPKDFERGEKGGGPPVPGGDFPQ